MDKDEVWRRALKRKLGQIEGLKAKGGELTNAQKEKVVREPELRAQLAALGPDPNESGDMSLPAAPSPATTQVQLQNGRIGGKLVPTTVGMPVFESEKDKEAWVKAATRKLGQIEGLKQMAKDGRELNAAQQGKVQRENELRAQLDSVQPGKHKPAQSGPDDGGVGQQLSGHQRQGRFGGNHQGAGRPVQDRAYRRPPVAPPKTHVDVPAFESDHDKEAWVKAAMRKLGQIEGLKQMARDGRELNEAQQGKVQRENELRAQVDAVTNPYGSRGSQYHRQQQPSTPCTDEGFRRATLKKLRQIEALKLRVTAGEVLNPLQMQKLSTEQSVRAALEQSGGVPDSSEVESAAKSYLASKRKPTPARAPVAKRQRADGLGDGIGGDTPRALGRERRVVNFDPVSEELGALVGQLHGMAKEGVKWGDVESREKWTELLIDMCEKMRAATPRQVSTLFWSLVRRAAEVSEELDTQAVATIIHALGSLQHRPPDALLARLLDRAQHLAPPPPAPPPARTFNSADISQFVWGMGRLKFKPEAPLLRGLLQHVTVVAKDLKPQEISMVMWGLGTLGCAPWHSDSVMMLLQRAGSMWLPAQACANILWAVAKMADYDETGMEGESLGLGAPTPTHEAALQKVVEGIVDRAIACAGDYNAQGIANLAWALARMGKLAGSSGSRAASAVVGRGLAVVSEMKSRDVCDVVWAVGELGVRDQRVIGAVVKRIEAVVGDMGWREVAVAEHGLRKIDGEAKSKGGLQGRLRERALVAVEEANAERRKDEDAVAKATADEVVDWVKEKVGKGAKVLVVGDVDESKTVSRALKKAANIDATRWHRCSGGARKGKAWMDGDWMAKGGDKFKSAVVCAGGIRQGFEMCLAATAEALEDGATAYVVDYAEHQHSVSGMVTLVNAVGVFAEVIGKRMGTAMVVTATRKAREKGEEKRELSDWKKKVKVQLPPVCGQEIEEDDREKKWVVYPGLFAGGGVDIMTTQLLACLPHPPKVEDKRVRVLDFACGSGIIAAALLARFPPTGSKAGLEVHLLDSDSVAMKAAKTNVKGLGVGGHYLSDSWAELPKSLEGKFQWIISNPPVHVGKSSDFKCLEELIKGGGRWLKKGGSLLLVAQTYVPVAFMFDPAVYTAKVIETNGRFTVWEAKKNA